MEEQLIGYDEWLDSIESTLPLPQEEDMERTKLIKQIIERLAELETFRAESISYPVTIKMIDTEMTELRYKLLLIMNNVCPIIKG